MCYLNLPLALARLKTANLQYLKDKIAGNFASEDWKNVNMADRRVLVHSVLDFAKEVIQRIIVLLCAYQWEGCAKVIGGKCKSN
jgi:hypothetical protein